MGGEWVPKPGSTGFGSQPVNLGGDAGLDEEMLLISGADVLTSYPFGDPMTGWPNGRGSP